MIRKIVKLRRVSRARERIMSLVTDSVTVQAMVLDNLSTVVGIATDQGYPDSVEKAILFFLKCLLSKHKCIDPFIHNLYEESPEPLFKLQSNESGDGLQQHQEFSMFSENLSLFDIINAFVYTLSSEDILALDKALKFGREGYYCLMKTPSSFLKSVNFQSDSVKLSDCAHSSEQPEESMEKCNKCVIRNFRPLNPCSRYMVGLTCSQCGTFRSKWTKHDSPPPNNYISKTSICCIDLLLAVCKAWRWEDLSPGDYLRRIGPCQFSEKHTNSQICLNPYHWSRVLIQDKINEKVHCSKYSSDPDIVCLGLKHINHPNCSNHESHVKGLNIGSEYPKDMMPLLLPPSTLSSLLSSSSSSTESTSAETQISSIRMDQSYDSVVSYDSITNNSSAPLLTNHDTYAKTKLTYWSPHFLHKMQQKLHMNLMNSVSSLTKWKRLRDNTNFTLSTCLVPSKDFNHTTPPPTTTTTTTTSISSSDDEMHSCSFILSSKNPINDSSLQNSNLHFNRFISINDHSVTINNEKSDLHSRLSSPSPLHYLKPWANISYWESHHHVGRRWYQITNRKLNIVYNDVNINDNDHNNNDVKDKLYSSPKQAHIHKKNHSNYRSKSQNDDIYLSLLTLYQSNHVKYNCKSDCNRSSNKLFKNNSTTPSITCHTNRISGNNSSVIRSSSKQCKKCYNYVDSFNDTSLIPNLIVHSSMYKSSSGWKQCCRLGSQGISLTLTTYGCVWLSNQALATNLPIFVSSPCFHFHNANCSSSSSSSLNSSAEDFLVDRPVYRVPAGYSLLVFDLSSYENWLQQHSSSSSSASSSSYRQYSGNNHNGDNSNLSGNSNNSNNIDFDELHKTHLWAKNNNLCKNPIIHISLGKGWGPSYRRPDVTHCPARLEVWINLEHLFPVFISNK
uniref:Mothers against decapentaplegic homolog n=2 Tax=Schistosoma mansoni TaxID=6183 RepID=A0A3Q0KSP0_SCHMA